MAIPRFTRGARYRISGIARSAYRTTINGARPESAEGTFAGLWRDDKIYVLFHLSSGGNMAIPLESIEHYDIERVEQPEPEPCRL